MTTLIALASIVAMTVGCKSGDTKANPFDITNLDTSVKPQDDFYDFACGGWMKKHPLTDEYARYGSFDKLGEDNRQEIKGLVEELAANIPTDTGVGKKIGVFYSVAMDSTKLNADGKAPMMPLLAEIAALNTKQDINKYFAEWSKKGFSFFFGLGIQADLKNSNVYTFGVYQGGISLPTKDYYSAKDSASVIVRAKYLKHIANMFVLVGDDAATAAKRANNIMGLETQIAKIQSSQVELRDPAANYNKMPASAAYKILAAFDLEQIVKTMIPNVAVDSINIAQMKFSKSLNKIYAKADIQTIKDYLSWQMIQGCAGCLSDDFVNESFDFEGKVLQGKKVIRPRWKRALGATNSVMSEAVGQMYVAKFFPPESKTRMVELVHNLQQAMIKRFEASTWMCDTTIERAKEKLLAVTIKIGYPDKWIDYTKLEVDTTSYLGNMIKACAFAQDYELSKYGKPVDKSEWGMPPQMVNAYYNPSSNEICFPAGILQPPFFYANGDDAINYGAIGVVIGHEMTHGFDDQGRQYDKFGNFNNWWAGTDADKFKARAQVIIDQFNNRIVLDTLHANGSLCQGENIADFGGLQIAYTAFQDVLAKKPQGKIDGYTPDQRFFLSYAGVWAGGIRPEEIRRLRNLDPHSLGRWRVNQTLPNVDAFVKAFDIKPGDTMYIAPEKRADIW